MPDPGAEGLLSPWLRKKRLQKARPYIHGKVLDYGCGVGALVELCKPDSYLGVDINEKAIEVARKNHPGFHFVTDIPQGEKFDTIISLAVIEHVSDPAALLEEFMVMLKPKGRIVLTTPHPSFKKIYTRGCKIGLFSPSAAEEHKQLIDHRSMWLLTSQVGLVIERYKRFLFGANQLFVLGQA